MTSATRLQTPIAILTDLDKGQYPTGMRTHRDQRFRWLLLTSTLLLIGATTGCARHTRVSPAQTASVPRAALARIGVLQPRRLRLTGSVEAVRSLMVRPPTVQGSNPMMTLVRLVANGARVKQGDVLAEFDATDEAERARQARAKYDGLAHQVEQKIAQNRSDAEQRNAALQQARADLAKAQLEIRKAPILSQIDADKARVNEQDAAAHVASLLRSNPLQGKADAAALEILELQRDRQKLEWQRAEGNIRHMRLLAPLTGIVALKSIWRNGSFGTAQEGDKIYRGNPLLSIFDPGAMIVSADLNEADHVQISPGMKAAVHLDAYPDAEFSATVQSVSPVATAPLGSPVRSFSIVLSLDQRDARLMPDLAAAVDLRPPPLPAALLVPRAAVRFAREQAWVRAQQQGHWQWQTVTLGAFDRNDIAVLNGLRAGQEVELAPSGAIPIHAWPAAAPAHPEAPR